MTVRTRTSKGKCAAKVEGPLTIYAVSEARDKLLKPLAKCEQMELNLSGVTEFDTAGFQLLTLLKRECLAAGIPFRVKDNSHAIEEVLDMYRYTDQFEPDASLAGDMAEAAS